MEKFGIFADNTEGGVITSNLVAEVTAVACNRAERQQWAALAYCF